MIIIHAIKTHFKFDSMVLVICIAFVLMLVIYSNTALNSAKNAINLCTEIVFPSLFPFFVVTSILSKTNFFKTAGRLLEPIMRPLFNVPGCGAFAFIIGITSGYPVGAKITSDLRNEKLLTRIEAERLLAFTNNSGPLFIIGAIAAGMLKRPDIGIVLLICHICACITTGILLRLYNPKKSILSDRIDSLAVMKKQRKLSKTCSAYNPPAWDEAFADAVSSSVMSMITISGYIVLFSVIIGLLIETGMIEFFAKIIFVFCDPSKIKFDSVISLLSGVFEITNAIDMEIKSSSVPFIEKVVIASAIMGWGGFSVHMQVLSIIKSTDIRISPYLFGKLLHAGFSALYTYIAFKLPYLIGDQTCSSVDDPQNIKTPLIGVLLSNPFFLFCLAAFLSVLLFMFIYFLNKKTVKE